MKAKFFKHKILLDENFFVPSYLPKLNKKFTVKHILQNPEHKGWSDWKVFRFASKNHMFVVTFNVKDFVDFVELSNTTGIVGISTNLSEEDIDKKLTALFTRSSKRSLFGKITFISGETK
ncbi:DUF5615 family PIN-like protein [Candidatus Daviesbacteria bacterium]|nr:DUF5615 family PIN-like protein [Candidatus Daviesbacteria bacterium]